MRGLTNSVYPPTAKRGSEGEAGHRRINLVGLNRRDGGAMGIVRRRRAKSNRWHWGWGVVLKAAGDIRWLEKRFPTGTKGSRQDFRG